MKRVLIFCWLLMTSVAVVDLPRPTAALASSHQATTDSQQQLKQLLHQHHINGIILINGTHQQPTVISNHSLRGHAGTVKADQLFPIASLQKLMTGLAIMQLVDQGQLSLTSSVSDFYPSIVFSNQITIQQLMMHHSGLRDLNKLPANNLKTEKQRLQFGQDNFQSTGNFNWTYADSDFVLLAGIIRQVSGQSYARYLRTKVLPKKVSRHFQPLQAVRQSAVPTANLSWSNLLTKMAIVPGSGDYFMTPRAYWQFVMQRLLDQPEVMQQFANQQRICGQETYFGGIYINQPIIHANGNFGNYSCAMYANYQQRKMVMIFADNLPYPQLRQINQQLFKEYFGYRYIKGTNQP